MQGSPGGCLIFSRTRKFKYSVKKGVFKGDNTQPLSEYINKFIPKKTLKKLIISGYGSNIKCNYIIPFLFSSLGVKIPTEAEPMVHFSFNILILSLIILFCFINITGYFISIYLLNKYNVEERYPKYSKIIRYFEKSRILFVTIEIFICFFCIILIILTNLGVLGIFLFI